MNRAAAAEKATAARVARRRALEAQAAQVGAGVRILASGVDTLHLHSTCPLYAHHGDRLAELKRQAVHCADVGDLAGLPTLTIAGHRFTVRPFGSKKGPYLLHSEYVDLVLNPEAPRRLPKISAELRADWLWSVGYTAAGRAVAQISAELSDAEQPKADTSLKLSRVDLCCDFAGWTPEAELRAEIVTRARRRAGHEEHRDTLDTHHRGRHFTGFSWGLGGAVTARLYDKAREIKTSNKLWMRTVWQQRGWRATDEKPQGVWRLEFQLRREALKETATLDDAGELQYVFDSWDTARDSLTALWRELSTSWVSWRLPRTATQRVRLHPVWNALVDGATFADDSWSAEVYRHRRLTQYEETLQQLGGWLSRALAEQWAEYGIPTALKGQDATEAMRVQFARVVLAADHQRKRRKGEDLVAAALQKLEAAEVARIAYCDARAEPLH